MKQQATLPQSRPPATSAHEERLPPCTYGPVLTSPVGTGGLFPFVTPDS